MKIKVDKYEFVQAFRNAGRFEGYNDNFSFEALHILFEYLEEYEDGAGEEMELDPIAICCDFAEMTKEDLVSSFDLELNSLNSEDEDDEEILEYLQENTSFVGKTERQEPTTYVFQSF